MAPAKEHYSKEAPALFNTALHTALMERTLKVYRAAAWGPSAATYEKKLREVRNTHTYTTHGHVVRVK